jgi:hypothetical protein
MVTNNKGYKGFHPMIFLAHFLLIQKVWEKIIQIFLFLKWNLKQISNNFTTL